MLLSMTVPDLHSTWKKSVAPVLEGCIIFKHSREEYPDARLVGRVMIYEKNKE